MADDSVEPTSFAIDQRSTDGVEVVAVRGELDLATAPQLRELLDGSAGGEAAVLIDLTGCEFIDSTGIAVIVRAWQERQGGNGMPENGLLALCAPDQQVARLLEVTGVGTSISVFEECDEGIAELRNRARSASASRDGTPG